MVGIRECRHHRHHGQCNPYSLQHGSSSPNMKPFNITGSHLAEQGPCPDPWTNNLTIKVPGNAERDVALLDRP